MEYTYSFTALRELDDSFQWNTQEDFYIPILSEISRFLFAICFLLYNRSIYLIHRSFVCRLRSLPGKMITDIKIEAPETATLYLTLGWTRVDDLTNIQQVSIPCVEYHSMEINGRLLKEGDTVTITYKLQDMIEPIKSFTIGNVFFKIKDNLYCNRMMRTESLH